MTPEPHLQTVLFAKVVLALMSGRPAEAYLDAQRARTPASACANSPKRKRSGDVADALLADHGLFHLEADLRWIDSTVARLGALAKEVAAHALKPLCSHGMRPAPVLRSDAGLARRHGHRRRG